MSDSAHRNIPAGNMIPTFDDSIANMRPYSEERPKRNLNETRQNSLLDDLPPIVNTSDQFKELRRVKREYNESGSYPTTTLAKDGNFTHGTAENQSYKGDEGFQSTVEEMIAMIDGQKTILKSIARDNSLAILKTTDNVANSALSSTNMIISTTSTQESHENFPTEHVILVSNTTNLHNTSNVTNFETTDNAAKFTLFSSTNATILKQKSHENLPPEHAILVSNTTDLYNASNVTNLETTDIAANFAPFSTPNATILTQQSYETLPTEHEAQISNKTTYYNASNVTHFTTNDTRSLEVKRSILPIEQNQIKTMASIILPALNEATTSQKDNITNQIKLDNATTLNQFDSFNTTITHFDMGSNTITSLLEFDNITRQADPIKTKKIFLLNTNIAPDLNKNTSSHQFDSNETTRSITTLEQFQLNKTTVSNKYNGTETVTLKKVALDQTINFNEKINYEQLDLDQAVTSRLSGFSRTPLDKTIPSNQVENNTATFALTKDTDENSYSNNIDSDFTKLDLNKTVNEFKEATIENRSTQESSTSNFEEAPIMNQSELLNVTSSHNETLISAPFSIKLNHVNVTDTDKKAEADQIDIGVVNVSSIENTTNNDSVTVDKKEELSDAVEYEMDTEPIPDIPDDIIREEITNWIKMQEPNHYETGKLLVTIQSS